MGVGEDENLGNEISVTVIATGFGQEQQNEISNTEAKKIIHSLEDEQKIVHNLIEDQDVNSKYHKSDDAFIKDDEENKKSEILDKEPLIPMNSILREIEVEAEIVSEGIMTNINYNNLNSIDEIQVNNSVINDSTDDEINNLKDNQDFIPETSITNENFEESLFKPEFDDVYESKEEIEELSIKNNIDEKCIAESNDFVFNEITKSVFEMEVIEPEEISGENQILLDFELPLSERNVDQERTSNNLSEKEEEITEDNHINNNDLQELSMDVQFELKTSSTKTIEENEIDVINEEASNNDQKINPFDQSINQTIASQSEKRKSHLEVFNHKFSHQFRKIEEIEKEPAYKRKGLDINSDAQDSPSRLSLDKDNNNDLQIRSNNSFLHDNVD